jgi:hypothetical protein
LAAHDAAGGTLPAGLALDGRTLLLRIDDAGARYPITVDPFLQQGSKLTGGVGENYFGYAVALSADGNTALIGGPLTNDRVGAAWVFTRSGGAWSAQATLTASPPSAGADFGGSVALSADGNTALVGGSFPDYGTGGGAAWVFTRSGATWSQEGGVLTGGGGIGEPSFGSSVALSGDGSTALIGGPNDATGVGAAWVFTRTGSTWSQQAKLTAGDFEKGAGLFGSSVALSSDGNTALVGAPDNNGDLGAAWAFTRSGATWSQRAVAATLSGAPKFGGSVALSGDGQTALVGGSGAESGVGAAWVFTSTGSGWIEQGELMAGGEVGDGAFGSSVSLSTDGATALIGAPGDSNDVGAAWVFAASGSTWTQQGGTLAGSGQIDGPPNWGGFGLSVALSGDTGTALVGSPDDGNDGTGAAWVFSTAPPPPTTTPVTTPRHVPKPPRLGPVSVTIVSAGSVTLRALHPTLWVETRETKPADLRLTLGNARRQRLASWTHIARAGLQKLALLLPASVRHAGPGRYILTVSPTGTSRGPSATATVTIRG